MPPKHGEDAEPVGDLVNMEFQTPRCVVGRFIPTVVARGEPFPHAVSDTRDVASVSEANVLRSKEAANVAGNAKRHRASPADDEGEEFARRLQEVIVWALRELGERAGHQVALGVADLLDRGKWRLMTDVSVGRDGEPLPETLWYRVEVEVSAGWSELVKARASALGVSEESARDEAKWTAMQNGLGLPDDPSQLDSPS